MSPISPSRAVGSFLTLLESRIVNQARYWTGYMVVPAHSNLAVLGGWWLGAAPMLLDFPPLSNVDGMAGCTSHDTLLNFHAHI